MPSLKASDDDYLANGLGFKVAQGYTFVLGKLNPPPLPFLDLMTYPVKPGHYIRIDLKEPPNQCPLWVKSGHFSLPPECPLSGVKRTFIGKVLEPAYRPMFPNCS